MRRKARVDTNQMAIIKVLRQAMISVQPLHSVGSGCPDILCGYQGENYLFEIKNALMPASQRKLTKSEQEWHETWRGDVEIIECAEDALVYIGILKPQGG